jgi:metal-responsive CopG/Arc/MetJ family transcriptional regulator
MSTNPSAAQAQKITVTLPRELIERLDDRVPSRQRSRFIANAIESQLAIEEQMAAVEETAGIWTEENHPELKTEEDIEAWLQNLRQSWPIAGVAEDE